MALGMINQALSEPLILLRRLPELAGTAEEKSKLEAFLEGCLEAIRRGAQVGYEKANRKNSALIS
jgi:hypothetical protein